MIGDRRHCRVESPCEAWVEATGDQVNIASDDVVMGYTYEEAARRLSLAEREDGGEVLSFGRRGWARYDTTDEAVLLSDGGRELKIPGLSSLWDDLAMAVAFSKDVSVRIGGEDVPVHASRLAHVLCARRAVSEAIREVGWAETPTDGDALDAVLKTVERVLREVAGNIDSLTEEDDEGLQS